MLDPSESVLRALLNLEGSADFEAVREWIEASYQQELVQSAEIGEIHRLRWSQGRIQELRDLLDTISGARRTLIALRR